MFAKRAGLLVLLLVSLGSICACISIRDIAADNFSRDVGSIVTSKAEGIGILHLVVPKSEELGDRVIADLRAEGTTKNVRLRLETREFLFTVQLYQVFGKGEK